MSDREGDSPIKLVLIGVLLIAGGAAGLVVFGDHLPAELSIAVAGRAQAGHVVTAAVDTTVHSKHKPAPHPTRITFVYEAGGAQREARSSAWAPAVTAAAVPGAEVPIEVSRFRPDWARVRGASLSDNGYGPLGFAFISLFGALLIGSTLRTHPRRS